MAIIKCPECGHEISDKAPVCPNCGVAIADQIVRCHNCGEVYFKSETACPHCHYDSRAFARVQESAQPTKPEEPTKPEQQYIAQPYNSNPVPPTPPETPTSAVPPVRPVPPTTNVPPTNQDRKEEQQPKKNKTVLYVIIAAVILVIASIFYFMNGDNNSNKEKEAYEYAMTSSDPSVLQSYLDTYTDADPAHRDSIQAHLARLQQTDQEWNNVLISGSKSALEDYLKKHPDTPHKQEIWNKIDTLDWNSAKTNNTAESYQGYLDAHADGVFVDLAQDALKKAKSKDIQPEEKQMISGLFKRFFQSINTRNEDGLTATCENILTSFLGKSMATKSDVITFMNKIYKANVTNMNWSIKNDYNIKKREVGSDEYEYQVTFSALQNVETEEGTSSKNQFRVAATVSPDGKVSAFNLTKIIE